MNEEQIAALGFMIFGIGFFLFVINMILRTEERDYNRKLSEAREFGYDQSRIQKEARPRSIFKK